MISTYRDYQINRSAMSEIMFCVLKALADAGLHGCCRASLADRSGYSSHYIRHVDVPLVEAGWIGKVSGRDGRWFITERGKIAVAIEIGRRTKKRARADKS